MLFNVFSKLKSCRRAITIWNRSLNSNSRVRIKVLQDRLDCAKRNALQWEGNVIKEIEQELIQELRQEEIFWAQKARLNWLKVGDRNTAYFHAHVLQRRQKNLIHGLYDTNGIWRFNLQDIQGIALNYFQNFYPSQSTSDFSSATLGFAPRITININNQLIAPVSLDEIKGEDGLTAHFYQRYWDIIGRDVSMAVKSFFEDDRMLKNTNHTIISLIPKVNQIKAMRDLRLISLCNVVYKIIAKILSIRF